MCRHDAFAAVRRGLSTVADRRPRGRSRLPKQTGPCGSWSVFLLSSFQAAKVPDPSEALPGVWAAPFGVSRTGPGQGTRFLLVIASVVKDASELFCSPAAPRST